MNEGFIKNLINRYFEKEHSERTQKLFRYWFRQNENQAEKDEAMEELWEQSQLSATDDTHIDFARLQQRIKHQEQHEKPVFVINRFVRYAAIVTLVLSTSAITYFATKQTPVQFSELTVPYGQCKKVALADGSEVWVNAGSTLIYPSRFDAETRSVYLSGEAKFSVTKNPHQPFIVKTNHINVQVLGTKFDVQAYPDMSYTTTTLVEGSVRVNLTADTTKHYILKPDEKLSFSNQKHQVSINRVEAVKLTSWNQGYLIFQGASFNEIVHTIERKYDININYDVEKYKGVTYYGKFNPDESVEQVISVLCKLAKDATYKIQGSNVYLQSR